MYLIYYFSIVFSSFDILICCIFLVTNLFLGHKPKCMRKLDGYTAKTEKCKTLGLFCSYIFKHFYSFRKKIFSWFKVLESLLLSLCFV